MRPIFVVLSLVVATGFTCSNGGQDTQALGAAPDFSAQGSEGKSHTLASLTEGGKTLVLYFVKHGCGANPRAVPLFKAVGEPYMKDEKVEFRVVFNDDKAAFEEFQKEFDVEFKGLLDPTMDVIKKYKARSSQAAAVVQNGKIVKFWKGFSKGSLTEIGEILAKATGKPFEADLSRAPVNESYG
ncbi:MAG: redoxin domain-containing protein [Armatimonadetes bacterium]|nr:redoxin domain-containing protein [Armatimonadota bacterium]